MNRLFIPGLLLRRAQRVSRAIAKLLTRANVNFAILGAEEKCTGDSARRLGDGFLFQELAQAKISTLSRHRVKRILTACPHCLNSRLKDYPQFGGNYAAVHHTQFLEELLAEGRLSPMRAAPPQIVTYHDPCYLARVNGIHDAPRRLLEAAAKDTGGRQTALREMSRNREKTFCCGAGGGRMWMEEEAQKRVCSVRAHEARSTGATTVAVGCPFCLTMMTDGVAAQTDSVPVMDVAEILAARLEL
jgi:Fe-S oxidoreductase